MKLELLVIYGSVRTARQGIGAARFVAGECRKRGHGVTRRALKAEREHATERSNCEAQTLGPQR